MGARILSDGKEILIRKQFEELAQTYSGLKLCKDGPGHWVIRGMLSFSATYQDVAITDAFSILIILPNDYPDSPPFVQETGGRIPADFHQYPDRTLCLGAPVEVWSRFKADPRLVTFVGSLVVEYLYAYAYLEKHGTLPFGELSHGCEGIREYYQDFFNTSDVQIILALLKLMADGAYRGHHTCPCGSEKILRKCHGPAMLDLVKKLSREQFLRDATNILYSFKESELKNFNWELLPNALKRELDEMAREKAKREKVA
jgi:hypothetical protein